MYAGSISVGDIFTHYAVAPQGQGVRGFFVLQQAFHSQGDEFLWWWVACFRRLSAVKMRCLLPVRLRWQDLQKKRNPQGTMEAGQLGSTAAPKGR
jgi:hypothetical protein